MVIGLEMQPKSKDGGSLQGKVNWEMLSGDEGEMNAKKAKNQHFFPLCQGMNQPKCVDGFLPLDVSSLFR